MRFWKVTGWGTRLPIRGWNGKVSRWQEIRKEGFGQRLGTDGVQGRCPNMQLWHIDYFELKLFKKQLVKEHLLSSVPLRAGSEFPMGRVPSLHLEGKFPPSQHKQKAWY